ncbi:hypothetical protein HK096_007533, partial [Nowakowskiella sp. JEL0078]
MSYSPSFNYSSVVLGDLLSLGHNIGAEFNYSHMNSLLLSLDEINQKRLEDLIRQAILFGMDLMPYILPSGFTASESVSSPPLIIEFPTSMDKVADFAGPHALSPNFLNTVESGMKPAWFPLVFDDKRFCEKQTRNPVSGVMGFEAGTKDLISFLFQLDGAGERTENIMFCNGE